jgi:hypothetical protein
MASDGPFRESHSHLSGSRYSVSVMSPSDDNNGPSVRRMAGLMVLIAFLFAAVSFVVLWLSIVGR